MKLNKHIRELAEEILQEYTSCYSEADEDYLAKMLKNKFGEVVREIFEEIEKALHGMAMEYIKAGHPAYFAVCEMVYRKVLRPVEKKYTEGEG